MTHASYTLTLADIARHLGVDFEGDDHQPIRGLATLKEAASDQVAFLANRAYLKDLATTQAAAVLLHPEHGKNCPVPRLEMENPYLGYAKLSQLFDPLPARDVPGIHPHGCGRRWRHAGRRCLRASECSDRAWGRAGRTRGRWGR